MEDWIERAVPKPEEPVAIRFHIEPDLVPVFGPISKRRKDQEFIDVSSEGLDIEVSLRHG